MWPKEVTLVTSLNPRVHCALDNVYLCIWGARSSLIFILWIKAALRSKDISEVTFLVCYLFIVPVSDQWLASWSHSLVNWCWWDLVGFKMYPHNYWRICYFWCCWWCFCYCTKMLLRLQLGCYCWYWRSLKPRNGFQFPQDLKILQKISLRSEELWNKIIEKLV